MKQIYSHGARVLYSFARKEFIYLKKLTQYLLGLLNSEIPGLNNLFVPQKGPFATLSRQLDKNPLRQYDLQIHL